MTEKKKTESMDQQSTFVDATDTVDELLAEPEIAEAIEAGRPAREAMNRAYAMNLALIRNAANLTQAELAKRLGIDQPAVSKLEARKDMLLSTLTNYLLATGAEAASIAVTVRGLDYTFDLTGLSSEDATESTYPGADLVKRITRLSPDGVEAVAKMLDAYDSFELGTGGPDLMVFEPHTGKLAVIEAKGSADGSLVAYTVMPSEADDAPFEHFAVRAVASRTYPGRPFAHVPGSSGNAAHLRRILDAFDSVTTGPDSKDLLVGSALRTAVNKLAAGIDVTLTTAEPPDPAAQSAARAGFMLGYAMKITGEEVDWADRLPMDKLAELADDIGRATDDIDDNDQAAQAEAVRGVLRAWKATAGEQGDRG